MFPTSPNSQRQPQGDEHPEGRSRDVTPGIFHGVPNIEVHGGTFTFANTERLLVTGGSFPGSRDVTPGIFHPVSNIEVHGGTFANIERLLVTGGSFPVASGDAEAVEHLVQQRTFREKKEKRSGEGRSPVSTLSSINHNPQLSHLRRY